MTEMLFRYYVYAYLDLEIHGRYEVNTNFGKFVFEYEPFYIGKGRGDRMLSHQNGTKNKKLFEKINNGTYEIIKIKENLPIDVAFSLESELIYKIGRKDLGKGPLVNETSGVYLHESKNIKEIGPLHLEFNKFILLLKALNKNRYLKYAALDLNVSERTLYRLINEYKLEKIDDEWVQNKD